MSAKLSFRNTFHRRRSPSAKNYHLKTSILRSAFGDGKFLNVEDLALNTSSSRGEETGLARKDGSKHLGVWVKSALQIHMKRGCNTYTWPWSKREVGFTWFFEENTKIQSSKSKYEGGDPWGFFSVWLHYFFSHYSSAAVATQARDELGCSAVLFFHAHVIISCLSQTRTWRWAGSNSSWVMEVRRKLCLL